MLCTSCPPTILGDVYRIPEKLPKSLADKMYRACETKDQTLKKIRTLHFPDNASAAFILRVQKSARSKPTTEFAQPRLSRVKARPSPARGYKFGCVRCCSYMAGHEDAGVVTGHIGTNTPKFVPPRWGRLRFDPTQTGCANSVVGLERAEEGHMVHLGFPEPKMTELPKTSENPT